MERWAYEGRTNPATGGAECQFVHETRKKARVPKNI